MNMLNDLYTVRYRIYEKMYFAPLRENCRIDGCFKNNQYLNLNYNFKSEKHV